MWPRFVVSEWWDSEERWRGHAVYCAFAHFTDDTVHWLAGTPGSLGRWDVPEVGRGTRASVSGVANAPPPTGFADDVVGFSRVSYFHWAPSIAAADTGAV